MIKSAGCIVYRKSRGFLLLKKKDFWEFPKGKIDSNDKDLLATALRETKEETGISELTVLAGFHEEEQYRIGKEPKQVDYFLATTTGNPKISSEHLGFCWVTAGEAEKYLSFPGKKTVFAKAVAFLEKKGLL